MAVSKNFFARDATPASCLLRLQKSEGVPIMYIEELRGAIYKKAYLRSVQAVRKKSIPFVSDSGLSRGFENAKAKSKLYCTQASDMEGQFQVPAILCSIPFCSCSSPEMVRIWASGEDHILFRECFLNVFVDVDWPRFKIGVGIAEISLF